MAGPSIACEPPRATMIVTMIPTITPDAAIPFFLPLSEMPPFLEFLSFWGLPRPLTLLRHPELKVGSPLRAEFSELRSNSLDALDLPPSKTLKLLRFELF